MLKKTPIQWDLKCLKDVTALTKPKASQEQHEMIDWLLQKLMEAEKLVSG
jgi:hypothetical protein